MDDSELKSIRELVKKLETFIPDDSSYWNEYRKDIYDKYCI